MSHGPNEGCSCRKPEVGLLTQIESEFQCVLHGAYFVGDSIKDLQAAEAFSMRPVLVRTGKGVRSEECLADYGLQATPVFDNLLDAVQQLISRNDV